MELPGGKSSSPAGMNRLTVSGAKVRRLVTRQVLFGGLAICVVWFLALQYRRHDDTKEWNNPQPQPQPQLQDLRTPPRRMPTHNVLPELGKRKACHGPRGRLMGENPDDELVEEDKNGRT